MTDSADNMINREKLLCLGWRQGAILPKNMETPDSRLATIRKNDHDFFIVLSQDCNILLENYNKEPFIEVLCAHDIPTQDKMLINGRNPREYQFSLPDAETYRCYSILAIERVCIDRRYLETASPSDFLPSSLMGNIAQWMALRYTRSPLPDELNRRLGQIQIKRKNSLRIIRKYLKESEATDDILDFYLDFDDVELPADKNYKLLFKVEIKDDANQNNTKLNKITILMDKVEELLNSPENGIEMDYEIATSNKITLEEFRTYKRWSIFDDLSY